MNLADVITLVSVTQEQDAFGVWQKVKIEREIFCYVNSVSRAEFFDGGRNGLNPEYTFTIFADDYNGEETLIYKGKAYGIYRTYHRNGDNLELYAERKGGANK